MSDRKNRRDGATDTAEKAELPDQPTAEEGPPSPTDLDKPSWWAILKRTVKQFQADNLTDWAAALTYYGVLSLFPGILVMVAGLRLTGPDTPGKVISSVKELAGAPAAPILDLIQNNLSNSPQSTAGVVAIVGLATALWSASGYIGAFMRASNAIYDVPEGRPVWKTLPIRLGVTIVSGIILAIAALAVVFTGGFAQKLGKALHLGSGVVLVWDIAKWPVLVLLISLLFAILYWASPNARHGGFKWVSPGSILAVVIWILASAGFALYITVAGSASYTKTYGALGGVIIFLVWLWISNIAILLGAEFDAEMQRERAIEAGHAPDDEPYMELRDTRKVKKGQHNDLG
jgi:membrane protein